MTSPLLGNTHLHNMVRYNAREEILQSIGDISDIELFGNQLIVAPYVHSGIMWSDRLGFPKEERLSLEALYDLYDSPRGFIYQTAAKESIFVGMVNLVIAVSPDATEHNLKRGEWIFTLQENTRSISITSSTAKKSKVLSKVGVDYAEGWPCKLLFETDVYGRIPYPDMVV